jgi:hypothetical protein
MNIPENEIGVRELFASRCDLLGYRIERSQRSFPDYELRDDQDQLLTAEVEFVSGNFKVHGHNPMACDLVICWQHTVPLPLPVLELASEEVFPPGALPESVQDGAAEAKLPADLPQWSPDVRDGRDELNLAEWPIAATAVRKRDDPGNRLTIEDQVWGRHGKLITRRWSVLGTDEYGLPTPFCEDVYVALMQLTHQAGFVGPEMKSSLREVCRCLAIKESGTATQRVTRALKCLTATTIEATNAFWDKKQGRYMDATFHILDWVITPSETERHLPLGQVYIRWNPELWANILAGSIKTLNMAFYVSLSGPLTKRLYRYLDKHRWDGKLQYRIGLRKLCVPHLGMADGYPSELKRNLDRVTEELIQGGFLHQAEYAPGREEELVVFTFPQPANASPEPPAQVEAELVLPLIDEQITQIRAELDTAEWEALEEEAWQRLSPAMRELVGRNRKHFFFQSEVNQLIREKFLDV